MSRQMKKCLNVESKCTSVQDVTSCRKSKLITSVKLSEEAYTRVRRQQ
jgi:hypothetical protein